jgi:hypothetical protein
MNAPLLKNTVQCPTCRASQEWSEACRRCQSDLTLLEDVAASYRYHRRECLLHLGAGRPLEALPHAHRCQRLHPDTESRRLQALCALLIGDWVTATNLARHLS